MLELANHLTRSGRFPQHPGTHRSGQLVQLLGGVTAQLEKLQNDAMSRSQENSRGRREAVSNGISLAVALCDSLGLIGDAQAVRPLNDLMEIKHRRVRVEAAAALVRLGQPQARRALMELAAEPSVRLRVLAYAEELGFPQEIDEQFSSPAAVAEAELVTYLSQPTNMGVPPSSCELVDSRTLYWPGFEEPRNCYLFRFTYHAAEADGGLSTFSNLGIAGPLVHAFQSTINDLPAATAYCLFAGWQAEHEDIVQFELQGSETVHPILSDFLQRLDYNEYSGIRPTIHGKFFGDDILVAECQLNADNPETGSAVVDAQQIYWHPHRSPLEAYCIYKGERLLQAFNDELG